MTETDLVVKGFSELQSFLDQLPANIEKRVEIGMLRAGAAVMKAEAVQKAPIDLPSGQASQYGAHAGSLRASIRISTKGSKGGKLLVSVVAGDRTAYYAHMVEYGTRRHTITASGKKALSIGGVFYQSVEHPGAAPHPFMRPAFDTAGPRAVVAAGEYVRQRLATKEGFSAASDVAVGLGEVDLEVTP